MKLAIATIQSITPYSPSKAHETPKLEREQPDAFEERTWREKAHYTETGEIYIPPMSFKMALDSAAKFKGDKIPGKRNATWTKHFLSGVLVTDPVLLGVQKDDAHRGRYYCNADGVRGSGKRVWRLFPEINKWGGVLTVHILDELITEKVFAETLSYAGNFIGVGRFRPQNGGFFGRFSVKSVDWRFAA